MLELRPNCECCDKDLPPESTEAMICTYECTFCADCAENVLNQTCPNCGGNFSPRPIRPMGMLQKHPASTKRVFQEGLLDNEIYHPGSIIYKPQVDPIRVHFRQFRRDMLRDIVQQDMHGEAIEQFASQEIEQKVPEKYQAKVLSDLQQEVSRLAPHKIPLTGISQEELADWLANDKAFADD